MKKYVKYLVFLLVVGVLISYGLNTKKVNIRKKYIMMLQVLQNILIGVVRLKEIVNIHTQTYFIQKIQLLKY